MPALAKRGRKWVACPFPSLGLGSRFCLSVAWMWIGADRMRIKTYALCMGESRVTDWPPIVPMLRRPTLAAGDPHARSSFPHRSLFVTPVPPSAGRKSRMVGEF